MSVRGDHRTGLDALRRAALEDGPTPEEEARLEARLLPLVGGASGTGGAGGTSGSGGTASAGNGFPAPLAKGGVVAKAIGVTAGTVAVTVTVAMLALYGPAPERPRLPKTDPRAVIAPPDEPETVAEPASHVARGPIVADSADTESPRPPAARALPPEHELVARARALLETDPERALAAARRHESLYENGVLAEERDVLGVEALCRLGRCAEARARARAFATRFPASPYHDRVRAAFRCADAAGPPEAEGETE